MKLVRVPNEKLSREGRKAAGKAFRDKRPRKSHAVWKAPKDRQDPVDLLIQSSKDRIPHLVSIRYERMVVESPFAFYRGAAAIMAAVRSPFGLALTALSRLL